MTATDRKLFELSGAEICSAPQEFKGLLERIDANLQPFPPTAQVAAQQGEGFPGFGVDLDEPTDTKSLPNFAILCLDRLNFV